MFEFLRCLRVGGSGGRSECPFGIEDLCPRSDRRPAIVLPDRGDVESQFLCRCVEPRSWKGVGKVPDFSGCAFEDGVHLRHCLRGECHEAMFVVGDIEKVVVATPTPLSFAPPPPPVIAFVVLAIAFGAVASSRESKRH